MSGQMSFADFVHSATTDSGTPSKLSPELAALWHDQRGQWEVAHNLAQEAGGKNGAWVHAYLHRKEGDLTNASYWYRLARRPVASGTLSAEWEQIVRNLLAVNGGSA